MNQPPITNPDISTANPYTVGTPPPVQPSKKSFNPIIVLLIIFAVVASLGISAYIWLLPKSTPTTPEITQVSPAPTFGLTLSQPADGELALNQEVLVKGTTSPDTSVVMYTDEDTSSVQSDSSGNFESTILLSPGINTLTVTAYANDGQEKTISQDIVFDQNSN